MKDKLKQFFSESVSLDVIEQILASEDDWRKLKPCRLGYALITFAAENPSDLSKIMDKACDTITRYQGQIDTITSNLVIVTHGTIPTIDFDASVIAGICQTLQQDFGSQIRIVYGVSDGHYGNLGSENCTRYTFVSPSFETAMQTLFSLDYGRVYEIESS